MISQIFSLHHNLSSGDRFLWGRKTVLRMIGRTDFMQQIGALDDLAIACSVNCNPDHHFVFTGQRRGALVWNCRRGGDTHLSRSGVYISAIDNALRGIFFEANVIVKRNGCAYGESIANPSAKLKRRSLKKVSGDEEKADQLIAESSIFFDKVINACLPRSWFPTVTPDQILRNRGMIAANVHGKSHQLDGSLQPARSDRLLT